MNRPPLSGPRVPALTLTSFLAAATLLACSQPPAETPDAGACPPCGPGYVCNEALLSCELTPAGLASKRIAEAKSGQNLPVKIPGAVVTGVIPPSDAYETAGFFVQAEQEGPGLFVAVDPDELTPPVQVGDRVNFQVTAMQGGTDGPQALGIGEYEQVATGVDVAPLIQDVSYRNDLITNSGAFDSEVLAVEGNLLQELHTIRPGQYFASMQSKGGFQNSKFGIVVTQKVADRVGVSTDCHVSVHAVPMRAFLASTELWSFNDDQITFSCPPDELEKTLATSPTEVRLEFQRAIAPETLKPNGGSFTIAGLSVINQTVSGKEVTLQTSPQTARQHYVIEIDPGLKDVLGGSVDTSDEVDGFDGYFPRAVLMLNEIDCNAQNERDLVELKVVQGGSTSGLQLTYDGEPKSDVLMTFPDAMVEQDDLIVVHLNADGFKGDAVYSETVSKDEQTASTNYPDAWDFVWEKTVCKADAAVLRIRNLRGDTQDGVPIFRSNAKMRPAEFGTTWLRALQMEQNPAQWLPSTCAGNWCSETTTPSSLSISVDNAGTGSSGSAHYSVQRLSDKDTNTNADWSAAKPATFGAPNF